MECKAIVCDCGKTAFWLVVGTGQFLSHLPEGTIEELEQEGKRWADECPICGASYLWKEHKAAEEEGR